MQVFPDLVGLGAESQRTRSPDGDTIDTHTLRTVTSSLTTWADTRGASTDTCSLPDDDDRTLSVYQPYSVRKSTIGSKTALAVDPHRPESGFWKDVRFWFDSFSNPFKACLSSH